MDNGNGAYGGVFNNAGIGNGQDVQRGRGGGLCFTGGAGRSRQHFIRIVWRQRTRFAAGRDFATGYANEVGHVRRNVHGDRYCSCTASRTFRVTVPCTITLPSIPNLEFVTNRQNSYVLPEATMASGAVTYAIAGELPSGISFNAQTRTISGQVSLTTSDTVMYTATDAAGCVATQRVNILVILPPLALAYPVEIPQAEAGVRFSYTMPAVTNAISNQVTYRMGGLPPGLSFDPDTRAITGTPTRSKAASDFSPDDYNPTYTVFDTGPPSRSLVQSYAHRITVRCTLALPDIEDESFRDTIAFSKTLPAATNVRGTAQYNLIGDVPSGLTWNAQTRTFTGRNTNTRGTFRFAWRVTDGTGCVATESFTIHITDRCGIYFTEILTTVVISGYPQLTTRRIEVGDDLTLRIQNVININGALVSELNFNAENESVWVRGGAPNSDWIFGVAGTGGISINVNEQDEIILQGRISEVRPDLRFSSFLGEVTASQYHVFTLVATLKDDPACQARINFGIFAEARFI